MWLAIILFVAILGLLAFLDTLKPKNFPPGPKWLPILGSALEINRLRKKTGFLVSATAELSKEYGPVVGIRVGQDRQVVVFGYEALKQMLTDDDLAGRPTGLFYQARTWEKRRGVIFTDEEFWQEQRRFIIRHLREFGFGRRDMGTMLEDEAQDLVTSVMGRMEKNTSIVVSMADFFNISVLNTLWTMLAGVRYNPEDKQLKTLQGLLSNLLQNIDMVGCLFSQFPFLRYVAPEYSGYNSYVKTHIQLWDFLRDEIKRHKETFKPGEARDFMDIYLETLNSPDKKDSFSESQLLAICLDMFMAGSETTNKSLCFCFLYLLLYPDVQKKAQEEIDHVIGRDRAPMLSDRPSMPYMEALIYEAIRMFVGQTYILPHRALRDTNLQGYFIPKDTMVVANMNGTLMSKEIWNDPDIFRPERFLKYGKVHVPHKYLPFGFGKHRCMGETLAKANVFLFTSTMLQRFTFSVPPGQPTPTTEVLDGVTPTPKPFKALISLRY